MRSLRGACEVDQIHVGAGPNFPGAVRELKAHSVPLHEWPANGKPDQPQAWKNTPWLSSSNPRLLRPDHFDPGNDELQDAVTGFRDDILRPLVTHRAAALYPRPPRRVEQFLSDLAFPSALLGCAERRDFLAAIRQLLVGSRGPKSFGEAVAVWHRRAASIAAMRHERRADRPGWPAICQPWLNPDGDHEIIPLTTAADLVEEGNVLEHCVGSYYEPCRRGDRQILSLRRNGAHAATIELVLSGGDKDLSIQVGQFKTRRNWRPDDASHEALKVFLAPSIAANTGSTGRP